MTRMTDDELESHVAALELTRAPWKISTSAEQRWLVYSSPQPDGTPGVMIATGIRFQVQARALARVPDAFTELAELRKWAQRTVRFLKAPESNAELFDIMGAAQRLGIE